MYSIPDLFSSSLLFCKNTQSFATYRKTSQKVLRQNIPISKAVSLFSD